MQRFSNSFPSPASVAHVYQGPAFSHLFIQNSLNLRSLQAVAGEFIISKTRLGRSFNVFFLYMVNKALNLSIQTSFSNQIYLLFSQSVLFTVSSILITHMLNKYITLYYIPLIHSHSNYKCLVIQFQKGL